MYFKLPIYNLKRYNYLKINILINELTIMIEKVFFVKRTIFVKNL